MLGAVVLPSLSVLSCIPPRSWRPCSSTGCRTTLAYLMGLLFASLRTTKLTSQYCLSPATASRATAKRRPPRIVYRRIEIVEVRSFYVGKPQLVGTSRPGEQKRHGLLLTVPP